MGRISASTGEGYTPKRNGTAFPKVRPHTMMTTLAYAATLCV